MSSSTENEQLEVRCDADGDAAVIWLAGELDPHTAPKLQRQIDQALVAGARHVVVDMERLTFIDSSGLSVVINLQRSLQQRDGSLQIRSLSPTARRLFDITGLSDHIPTTDPEPAP